MPIRNKNADPCTATGCLWPKTGRFVYVPFEISAEYSTAERNIIINSLVSFHQSTCIRFVWRASQHTDYISFFSGDGCWSYVGRVGRKQNISLLRYGCLYLKTIQHEVLHALGFHHEQVRSDRDSYVRILTQNIQPGMESNFNKVATNNLGTPYDFNSVMQYVESLDLWDVIFKANANTSSPLVHGDIMPSTNKNADPCTATGCLWPKTGGFVYVPFTISSEYSSTEYNIIMSSLVSFHGTTCIRFIQRSLWHRDYLYFYSGDGCWSYVGRDGGKQSVSLLKNGCLNQHTIQHEVLHALGFHHEQVRSDRDSYVQILTQNIQPGMEHNFNKVATNNLGTPYDFNSVMEYGNRAFSKNGEPTILSKADPNLVFGKARDMSANDIARVKKLYKC
ncbi:hatching enzyme 1.2-like [Xenentodon cancila]